MYIQRDTNSKCMNRADNSLCTRCGCSKHYRMEMCPASSARCHKCDKRGHYSAQCFSRKASASASQVSLDCAFLDTVGDGSTSCWTTQVLLQNQMVTFKLDTGAEVTAVSEATFKSLTEVVLKQPDRKLFGPTHQALEVVGEFRGKLSVGDNMYQGDICYSRTQEQFSRALCNHQLTTHTSTLFNCYSPKCSTTIPKSLWWTWHIWRRICHQTA